MNTTNNRGIIVFLAKAIIVAALSFSQTSKAQQLPNEYLGLKLLSTVADAKKRIPLDCLKPNKKDGDIVVSCFYSGSIDKNKTYRLINRTKEIALDFSNNRLTSITVNFGSAEPGYFDQLYSYFVLSYGPAEHDVDDLGLFKMHWYGWKNPSVSNVLIRSTGRRLNNEYFDDYSSIISVINPAER